MITCKHGLVNITGEPMDTAVDLTVVLMSYMEMLKENGMSHEGIRNLMQAIEKAAVKKFMEKEGKENVNQD